MMKKLKYFAIVVACCMAVMSCVLPSDEPEFKPSQDAKHTSLVYMMADNNLGYVYHFDDSNIYDMCRALIDKNVNGRLMIMLSQKNSSPKLLEILTNENGECSIDTLKVYDGCLTTDTATLGQVIRDVREISPTDSHGLIVWTHANGWLPQYYFYKAPAKAPSSIGLEGTEQRTMDLDMFAKTLQPYHFDYIIFDACLMACVEVAYELRNVCDYIVATPTETMGAGFPYYDIVPMIFADTIDYVGIAKAYEKKYIKPAGEQGSITLIETKYLDELADVCKQIVTGRDADIAAIRKTALQAYDRKTPHLYYDLDHYMMQLADENQYALLQEALNKVVPYKAASSTFLGISIWHYSGLSSYIPGVVNDKVVINYYRSLQWYDSVYRNR
ncbi:MAG: hypothetical protein IKY75_06855 [Bacteroidaceae bacterium]|nr:hypothetical protein [Bacteroidaceae bacterium]